MERSSRKPKRPVALDVVLPHPARTPMPAELRRGLAPARRPSEVGQRRAKGLQSGYVATSPMSARLDRQSIEHQIVDIGMRMLEPHELLRAQFGRFAATYDLSAARTKAAKVRLIGNSVCPEAAEAVVRANVGGDTARRAA